MGSIAAALRRPKMVIARMLVRGGLLMLTLTAAMATVKAVGRTQASAHRASTQSIRVDVQSPYSPAGAVCSQRAIKPPITPPTIGATQNSHTQESAMPPPKIAVAVERAGLTDALLIGMATR